MSKIGQVYHTLEVLNSVYWHLQTQLLMSAAEIRAQVFILSLSDMIRDLKIALKWLEKHSWSLYSKSVQLLKRCIYSTMRIKNKKNHFEAMIILFSLILGFWWHLQRHRFMCVNCKVHEKAMQPGMTGNEHQVYILSVVQAGLSNERNVTW